MKLRALLKTFLKLEKEHQDMTKGPKAKRSQNDTT